MKANKVSLLWQIMNMIAIVSLNFTLAACTPLTSAPTPTAVPPTKTPTAIPEHTPTPIPVVVVRPATGEEFTDTQKTLINYTTELKIWRESLDAYWRYWTKADVPAVRLEWLTNAEIPLVPVFDPFDPENARAAWMYVDIPYAQSDCFSLPWVNGGFQFDIPRSYPTDADGKTVIETGQGPNLFTKSGMDEKGRFWYLSSEAGKPVRREVGSDKVLYQLDAAGFWVEPVDRLKEMLSIVYSESHTVTLKNGRTVSYTLETDQTKADHQVTLNGYFKDAEYNLAWMIDDAMTKSAEKNGGKMKFKAYWDGEKEPRMGEMDRPITPVRIVFIDERKLNGFDEPVGKNILLVPDLFWIYVNGGQIVLLVCTRDNSSYATGFAGNEIDSVDIGLTSLFSNGYTSGYTYGSKITTNGGLPFLFAYKK